MIKPVQVGETAYLISPMAGLIKTSIFAMDMSFILTDLD